MNHPVPPTRFHPHRPGIKRRAVLKAAGAAAVTGTIGVSHAAQAAEPTMTTVVKILGVPYFTLLGHGLAAGGTTFGITSNMIGPANLDPAEQVRLIEDLIAKKVDVLGLIPLDVNVLAPVVHRARDAGIVVITNEGPKMTGRTWDVEMVDSTLRTGDDEMSRQPDGRERRIHLHRRHADDAASQPLV